MRIWCISDTHCDHSKLIIPDNIDMIIHAGDAGSHRNLSNNEAELRSFLRWYDSLPVEYKIYVPGNHDTSIEENMFDFKDYTDIIILNHNSIKIENINFFGSPYTPSFGIGWAYNVSRHKISEKWKDIPSNTDILITHGPPKGILDYTASSNNTYEQCGCKSLLNKIKEVEPRYHIFGHIHDESNVLNCGTTTINNLKTKFINACIKNLAYKIVNNGIIIEINEKTDNTKESTTV